MVKAQTAQSVTEGNFEVFLDDNKTEMRMFFQNSGRLDELNDDWYILYSDSQIVQMADGGDQLTFALK